MKKLLIGLLLCSACATTKPHKSLLMKAVLGESDGMPDTECIMPPEELYGAALMECKDADLPNSMFCAYAAEISINKADNFICFYGLYRASCESQFVVSIANCIPVEIAKQQIEQQKRMHDAQSGQQRL